MRNMSQKQYSTQLLATRMTPFEALFVVYVRYRLGRWPELTNRIAIKGSMFLPIGSIYTYIWWIFMVNVAKYTIDGWYGID